MIEEIPKKSRKPFVRTEKHRRSISLALKGKPKTIEHVQHMAASLRGYKHTEEWKLKHSRQLKGRRVSPFSEVDTKSQFYLKYGFGCLVIWQHELKEPEKIVQKVRAFSNG